MKTAKPLKFGFITGSLRDGCGIADTTRVLSQQLVLLGHKVVLLGIFDFALTTQESQEGSQTSSDIPTLRLSDKLSWQRRTEIAEEFLNRHQVEIVSLQFVGYSFHQKGNVFGLSKYFNRLWKDRFRHVLMYELWVASMPQVSLRHRLLGVFQRFCVLRLVRNLRPNLIHVNSLAYQEVLRSERVSSTQIDLIPSISLGYSNANSWLWPLLSTKGFTITEQNRAEYVLFGTLGTLYLDRYGNSHLSVLIRFLKELQGEQKKTPLILVFGKTGKGIETWKKEFDSAGLGKQLIDLGVLEAFQISEVMQSLDFGINTTSHLLHEKSSAVANMLQHGLSVISIRDDIPMPRGLKLKGKFNPRVIPIEELSISSMNEMKKVDAPSVVATLTQRFVDDIMEERNKLQR